MSLLAEIVQALGTSNIKVEKVFSQFRTLLDNQKTSVSSDTLNNILLIQANHDAWTENEQREILDAAQLAYMQTLQKRARHFEQQPFSLSTEEIEQSDQCYTSSEEFESDLEVYE